MNNGHHNATGRYHEVLFKAECMKRNLVVLSPEYTHLPFDVVVFSGNRFIKVQIKGTCVKQKRKQTDGYGFHHFYRVNCFAGTSPKRIKYSQLGVDILAAYVDPLKTWYIAPTQVLTGMTFEIYENSIDGKSAEFKERWDLLG